MSANIEIKDVKVKDLQPFENKFRLNFKVIEKSEEREVTNKNNPSEKHRISDVTVADDTGAIILSAWDDDIDFLAEGSFFKIENGYVNVFRDSMRLSKGKFGDFQPIEDDFEVDTSSNRSDETHERYPNRSNYNRNQGYNRGGGGGGYNNDSRPRERRLRF
ncbi:MAG: single-stranded DNA-binding protein [Candidatus Hodarchaeales archaeon]|jgi:ssDNA-binding replication factor A large subunit